MADFKQAHRLTLAIEGGYSNDKDDPGGETFKGIARNYHPTWEGWEIIDSIKNKPCFPQCAMANDELTKLENSFYKKKFWDVMKLDYLVNQRVANELYDSGVNIGWRKVAKWFQEALNLLNRDQKDYNDLVVDGAIGNKSLEAFKSYMNTGKFGSRSRDKNEQVIIKLLNYYQIHHYVSITGSKPKFEKYIYGWIFNRG